jgi:hypothetical protein
MTIVYADSRDPTVAVFSAADQTWKQPSKVRVTGSNGTPGLIDYYPERRRLGEDFWKLFYGEDSEIDDRALTFETTQKQHLDWVTELPAMKLDGVLDWNNHLTRAFRTPGLKAHDLCLLDRLGRWLHREATDGDVAVNATQFTYQKTRTEAFEEILKAIADPTERERGEIALWETLADALSPTLSTLLAENKLDGASRARLINAIRREDESKTLEYLFHAADADQLNDLNANANVCLQTILDRSVKTGGADILSLHSNLLSLDEMPELYRNWVIPNRLEFLKLSAQALGAVNEQISERLFNLSKDDAIPALLNLDRNLALDKKDRVTLERLSASERETFIWFLDQRWKQVDGDVGARRENLYPWLKALQPTNSGKALWALALNESVTLNDQCAEIVDEVKNGHVPVSQWEQVAAKVLELWPKFSAHVRKNPNTWEGITKLFPNDLEKLLFGVLTAQAPRKVSREIREAAQKCRPDPDEVNQLITFWMQFDRFANFGELLWQWAISDTATKGASGLISRISRFQQLEMGTNPTWNDLDEVVELASAAGQKDFFLKNEDRLWKPSLEGWQAFLMLRLMPQADITPTLKQLNSLIPFRERLRHHLDEHVSATLGQRFRLATLKFHELEYEKDQKLWHDDYVKCDLWAVFRRVPLRKQPRGSLRSALRSFSDGLEGINVIETRARMCLDYLNTYSTSKDYEAALRKVLIEGLIPLLIKRGNSSEEILRLVTNTHKNLSPGWGGGFLRSLFPRMGEHHRVFIEPPGLEELLSTVVSGYMSEGDLSADLRSFFRD